MTSLHPPDQRHWVPATFDPAILDRTNRRPRDPRVATLLEALPYIRRFAGRTIVVKYGGAAMAAASEPAFTLPGTGWPRRSC